MTTERYCRVRLGERGLLLEGLDGSAMRLLTQGAYVDLILLLPEDDKGKLTIHNELSPKHARMLGRFLLDYAEDREEK